MELSRPVPGNHVLDVATGTGVNAFLLAETMGDEGRVVGMDSSPGMLEVARSKTPPPGTLTPEFLQMDACGATDLTKPWAQTFDRAYCHQGLQFFENSEEACKRVRLALKPGGQFTMAIWAPLEHQPLFLAVQRALMALGKHEWAMMSGKPFSWHSSNAKGIDKLEMTLIKAGFDAPDVGVEEGEVEFGSLEEAAAVISAAPFGEQLMADKELWGKYVAEVETHLAQTTARSGGLQFRPGRIWGVGGKGEGSVLAIPAVALFGHATAPWH